MSGSTGSTMHFERQLNDIAILERIKIVCKLFCVYMLEECRSIVYLCFTLIQRSGNTRELVLLRNILTTNLLAVDNINRVADLQFGNRTEVSKANDREPQAVRFFTAKPERLDVTFIGIQKSTDLIAVLVLPANKIIRGTETF